MWTIKMHDENYKLTIVELVLILILYFMLLQYAQTCDVQFDELELVLCFIALCLHLKFDIKQKKYLK